MDGRIERTETEMAVYTLLERLGIEYFQIDHMPADTMDVCDSINSSLGTLICKNLFLCNRQQTDFYLLMIAGDKIFKTKDLSSQLGCSRLSFAGEEPMQKYLNIKPGSVSVLGLMNDTENHVRLLIDRDVLGHDTFGCHPCVNTSSLRLKVNDLLNKILPAIHHEYTIVDLPKCVTETKVSATHAL